MKNYYEILEVSQNASQEVIEKAYKALVIKYHPDLKNSTENYDDTKIKEINEAYEILSNPIKREQFDNELKHKKIQDEKKKYAQMKKDFESRAQNQKINETQSTINNKIVEKRVIKPPSKIQNNNNSEKISENEYLINNIYKEAYKEAYNQAYINTLKNMGYTIQYQKTFKQHLYTFLAFVFAFFVLFIIGFILWHIPITKNYFIDLYNNNQIVKIFIDIIQNIIQSFLSIFKK